MSALERALGFASSLLAGSALLACATSRVPPAPRADPAPPSPIPLTSSGTPPAPELPRNPVDQQDFPPPEVVVEQFPDPARRQKLLDALAPLDAFVRERGKALGVPGLFVGVVIDGELAKSASYGVRDVASGAPVGENSIFRIGSITKTFTATAILMLRDEGKLELDRPASEYLPELSRLLYPSDDSPAVTIRHLLTHTSGLPRNGRFDSDRTDRDVSEAEVLGALTDLRLEAAPGARYRYSNFGFSLLGVLIARVSGTPYRAFLQQRLFDPLDLDSAGWEPRTLPAGRLAVSYQRGKPGSFVPDPAYARLGASEADGGLYLSGRDFARFLAWQLEAYPARDGSDLGPLRRSSLREAHAPSHAIGLEVGVAASSSRWLASARATAVGFGWHSSASCDVSRVVSHNGWVDHYKSEAVFLPDRGVGVFAFANTAPVELAGIRAKVVDLLIGSGALVPRRRLAKQTQSLDRALQELVELQNAWDEAKYTRLMSEAHRARVPKERERVELAGYRELHGSCSPGPMLEYLGAGSARFALRCERAELEMTLALAGSSLISGFSGRSRGVPEIPNSRAAAQRLLTPLNRPHAELAPLFAEAAANPAELAAQAEEYRLERGACRLGAALDRDGNGWQRFALKCNKGGAAALALRFETPSGGRPSEFSVASAEGAACAEK